jgi:hypothetical protein
MNIVITGKVPKVFQDDLFDLYLSTRVKPKQVKVSKKPSETTKSN